MLALITFWQRIMKKYIFGIISFALIISLLGIGGEIATRVYHHLKYTKNQSSGKSITLDEELGWLPASNYVFNADKKDASGKSYSVKIQANNDGLRIFGNPQEENKKKVLFLGDSFTHAIEVSDNKTYCSILKNTLSIEVFAIGVRGYGTLQEYMILDKYVDEIRPDIIVIQFHSNDFSNNYYELELRSIWHNNAMRRPYFTNNGIIYRLPKNFPAIRHIINKYSQFLYAIIGRIDLLKARHSKPVEYIIQEKGMSYPFFRDSVEITEQLIKKIKLRIPSTTQVYAFSADGINPFYDELKRISEINGIHFIDGIPQAVGSAKIATRAEDNSHWNEAGHQIAANVLEHYFEANW